jgi:glucose-6-phosphate-specific signal transduction histidine kinase
VLYLGLNDDGGGLESHADVHGKPIRAERERDGRGME